MLLQAIITELGNQMQIWGSQGHSEHFKVTFT